jgi:hypothetical protein
MYAWKYFIYKLQDLSKQIYAGIVINEAALLLFPRS